jgi:hypothetical protein
MFVVLSERVGIVGAIFDVEAARAKGYHIEALVAGGFIGEASPNPKPKTTKVKTKNAEQGN